ncbi:MAG: hypothetical protein ACK5JO_13635 [Halodesulfovibrio sp.]
MMFVRLENVAEFPSGVWNVQIEPQRLAHLGTPLSQQGNTSVLLIRSPAYDLQRKTIEFSLESVLLLNLGRTSQTFLVDAGLDQEHTALLVGGVPKYEGCGGDKFFLDKLKSLPSDREALGVDILRAVRSCLAGELVYKEKSQKFVESPDNYWVVRIQPRVKNLRIIIYGIPSDHKNYSRIELAKDMSSYSSFLVESSEQVEEAVDAILSAKQLKDRRR